MAGSDRAADVHCLAHRSGAVAVVVAQVRSAPLLSLRARVSLPRTALPMLTTLASPGVRLAGLDDLLLEAALAAVRAEDAVARGLDPVHGLCRIVLSQRCAGA